MPVDRFLAACLIEIDPDYQFMKVWNAGMPDILITDAEGTLRQKINSINMPLGIKPLRGIDIFPIRFNLDEGDQIYCYTDGLIENSNQAGEMFGVNRLLKSISDKTEPDEKFKNIIIQLKKFRELRELDDDVALLQISCNKPLVKMQKKQGEICDSARPLDWNIELELNANTLRHSNPIPILLQAMSDIQGFEKHREKLFLILTEMYSNALEHGLLKLDSRVKAEENGFSKYYELRQSLLNELDDAKMKININHVSDDNKGVAYISVGHDGDGFEYENFDGCLNKTSDQFGRGLVLLSSLCRKYSYSNEGRQMQVEYEWEYSDMDNSTL